MRLYHESLWRSPDSRVPTRREPVAASRVRSVAAPRFAAPRRLGARAARASSCARTDASRVLATSTARFASSSSRIFERRLVLGRITQAGFESSTAAISFSRRRAAKPRRRAKSPPRSFSPGRLLGRRTRECSTPEQSARWESRMLARLRSLRFPRLHLRAYLLDVARALDGAQTKR